ncbi:ABC transporter substrate-binding protein [Nocardioides mangrovi]|uniref:ABC transporter substrate-binding protein n=1 Tax=Nocardioides mangrovi TaxID=2874580 RepID=A0ABS7UEI6_9ACTN|nr:ABC transporter substrate-binding protein [Nocardioides mangrovi]MBZ5739414.1 ABC transporter substrate-binding protein [Nocardioides mangrovi]
MRTSRIAVAVAALVLPTMAACASTSDGGDGATSDPNTIVIGYLGAESAMTDVMAASVKALNDDGGIDGKTVKLVTKITPEPADGVAAVKELIDDDHVVAIVGQTNNADQQWQQYPAQKGVPVIGGLNVNVPYVTNPDFFPTGANLYAMAYGVMDLASTVGDSTGALYCAESPQCAQLPTFVELLGGMLGVETPVTVKVSTTGGDWTAACQALIDGKVDSYQIAADGPAVVKIANSCYDQGLRSRVVTGDATVRSSFLKYPAFDGMLAAGTTVPFIDDSTPGTKAYQEMLATYLPDLGDENGPLPMNSYIAVQLFKKAVELGGTDEVTSASIKDGLYQMKDETLDGLTVPITYTEGKPTIINCYYTLGIENGKFTEPDGLKTKCAPDDLIDTILKASSAVVS